MANDPFPFSPSILTSVVLPPRRNLQAWILKYWAPTPSSRSSATGLNISKFLFTPAASRSMDARQSLRLAGWGHDDNDKAKFLRLSAPVVTGQYFELSSYRTCISIQKG